MWKFIYQNIRPLYGCAHCGRYIGPDRSVCADCKVETPFAKTLRQEYEEMMGTLEESNARLMRYYRGELLGALRFRGERHG